MRVPIVLSIAAAVLATGTSLAGMLVRSTYAREADAWAVQAVGQDIANLVVAVVLLISAVAVRRGSDRGLLVWLGSLLYFIYAFAIYAFAVHFNLWFLAYVAVLGLSFHALVGTLATLDVARVAALLRGHPHRQGAGRLLIAIGLLFAVVWLAEIVPHLLANTIPPALEETALWTNPVHVLDLAFLLPAMVLVGVLLRRQHPWGLVMAVPLLVFSVTMGLGILSLFALSATRGFPVSVPAVVAVAAIVVLSGTYVVRLLRPGPAPTHVEALT